MEARSLENLEFPKVLALVAAFAGSKAAKETISASLPSSDLQQVTRWLSELDELNAVLDGGHHVPIGGIRDMRDLFTLLGHGEEILSGEELLRVRANIETCRGLRKALAEATRIPLLREKLDRLPDLSDVSQAITQAISEQGEIRDDASPRLLAIRRDLVKSRQDIERRLGEYLASHAEISQDHFFTIRNERYVLPIKASFQGQIQGIIHDQSGSGQTLFMEPLEFLGPNNRLARLKAEDREEVVRILSALTQLLASHRDELQVIFDGLIFFDVLYAKARFARKYQANRPEIVAHGRLMMKNARHPLLHPDCVPMEISMDSKVACIVITGPNGGGKTVALKGLGLNVLLMQIGCYVLASHDSQIPVFDEVLVDIGEAQSIEDHLSTFTAHIQRLNQILSRATASSLVLIDEIGGGTDPVEGAALGVGVLRALVRRGSFSVVTSHYDALKQAAFTNKGFMNAGMEFDYQTLRPTFRFTQGIPGKSNALAISRMFGVPDEVIQEMSDLLEGKGGPETELISALEQERAHAETLRRTWEEKEREVSLKQVSLEAGLKKIEEFRRSRRDELVEAFEEKWKTRMKEIETLVCDLKKRLSEGMPVDADLTIARQAWSGVSQGLKELRDLPSESTQARFDSAASGMIRPGDRVGWSGFSSCGIVEAIDPEGKRAHVDFDGKHLSVAVSELRQIAPDKLLKKTGSGIIGLTSATRVREEIDLRGMRVEEGLEQAESYLRIAEAQGLGKVFLIHGKGTGALQKAIHEYLKKSPYRKKFRFGRYGEGDMGVTVVVFTPGADDEPHNEALESRNRTKKPARKS